MTSGVEPTKIASKPAQSQAGTEGVLTAEKILKNIKAPQFPNRDITISDKTNTRAAIQKAVEDLTAQGGGRVVVPAGEWQIAGPIHLKNNVNLHVSKGARLLFSDDPKHYLPLVRVRWEGTICYNYSPLIYAIGQKNIAVTGEGTLDGNCERFWSTWKKPQEETKKIIRKMGNDVVPDSMRRFGEGYFLRPSLIEFHNCENILLENFTIKSSPFWTIHPVFCKNITGRGLNIKKGVTNDDGFDPDSCEDVLIENCDIHTNDDAIALKAGRDQDAWQRGSTRRVVVRNCRVSTEIANGFCIGSEMSGGVEDVFVENYTVVKTDYALNFKCNLDRGGFIRNINIRDMKVDSSGRACILFQMDYNGYRGGNYPPDFRDFKIDNLMCKNTEGVGVKIVGVESKLVKNVALKNVDIKKAKSEKEVRFTENISMQNVRVNGIEQK